MREETKVGKKLMSVVVAGVVCDGGPKDWDDAVPAYIACGVSLAQIVG